MNNDELRKALFGNTPQPPRSSTPFSELYRNTLIPAKPPVLKFAKPKVFVSFDYENDRNYKRLLEAWSANTRFQFTFQDKTPQEVQTESVARVKGVLTTKVQQATHVLVLVGKYANQRHADAQEIGCLNWIHFECQQAMLYKKKIVAVLLEPNNLLPSNIIGAQGVRVDGFNQADIITALSRVQK